MNGTITEMPPTFTSWVDENYDRIMRADERGTLPYFLRDNRKHWDSNYYEEIGAKGFSIKGASRGETKRVFNEIIDEKYYGKVELTYKQKQNLKEIKQILGIKGETKPMSFIEADSGNSNKFRNNQDYNNNCVPCVVANELRRRGIDATAGKENDYYANNFTECWKTLNGDKLDYLIPREKTIGSNESDTFAKINKAMNVENGRYVIGWDGKNDILGHVLCAEKINGSFVFYDPQERKDQCFWTFGEIYDKADITKGLEIIRIDDKLLNVDAISKICLNF